MRLGMMLVVLALGGCHGVPLDNKADTAPAVAPATTAAAMPKESAIGPMTISRIGGTDTFAIVFPEEAAHQAVEDRARAACASKTFCKVLGWSDPKFAASAWPLTDREAEAETFNYSLNRASGVDEAAWSCRLGKTPTCF